jgi:hypothetical protein
LSTISILIIMLNSSHLGRVYKQYKYSATLFTFYLYFVTSLKIFASVLLLNGSAFINRVPLHSLRLEFHLIINISNTLFL